MQYDFIFEGGGAKGTVFVAATQEFEGAEHTCDHLLGKSADAITVSLVAAGYSSRRMRMVQFACESPNLGAIEFRISPFDTVANYRRFFTQ